jgi:uncharacterized protein (DUF983 family)
MWRLLGRGVARRCPACGAGDVFVSWFRLRERCPRCAARLEREPAFFIGAYFLNFCLMQAVLGAWIVAAGVIAVAGFVVLATIMSLTKAGRRFR